MTEIWLAFAAGLAGSFHCVGMCGGIVTALSLTGGGGTLGRGLRRQLFYHLGRISTYALLGAAAGWLGSVLNAGLMYSVSYWLFLAGNLCVIAIGLGSAFGFGRVNISSLEGSGARFLAVPLRYLISLDSPATAYPLGLLLGFLPCGLVYAPLPAAAAAGTPLMGGAIMAALGVGTVPALFLCGSLSGAASGALRGVMVRCAGVSVALLGGAGLWRVLARACPMCGM